MSKIASSQKRIAAFVIDDIIISLLFFAIFFDQIDSLLASEITSLFMNKDLLVVSPETMQHISEKTTLFIKENLLVFIAIKIMYHTFLIWNNGMTFGKYMLKIKAVDEKSGANLSFGKSLLRATVRILSEFVLYFGFFIAFFNPKVQTLHDKISGVIVADA
ncbi:MAG: RDD family protein [Campylobacterales bacterium]|nr:RDD family protein [Campylobacterales bacterium]